MKDCDKLTRMETTREDLLVLNETEVDSTTDCESSPIKKKKVIPKKTTSAEKSVKKTISAEKSAKCAQIAAAKGRAQEIFKTGECVHLYTKTTKCKQDCAVI